jgi:hypothetical protein
VSDYLAALLDLIDEMDKIAVRARDLLEGLEVRIADAEEACFSTSF